LDGLLVQQPYADLIASGEKTWELRLSRLPVPDRFYLLATTAVKLKSGGYDPARLGVVVGVARSLGWRGPFTLEELERHRVLHRATSAELRSYAGDQRLYALEVRGEPMKPRHYRMKAGSVTIVRDVELL
jgi:hypothetical protein